MFPTHFQYVPLQGDTGEDESSTIRRCVLEYIEELRALDRIPAMSDREIQTVMDLYIPALLHELRSDAQYANFKQVGRIREFVRATMRLG